MSREELIKLYNTLITIETKGEHTKTMADCLRFIEQAANRPVEEHTGEKCSEPEK